MASTDSSYLMFCGSYTNFDILAHLPNNDKVGQGVYCFHFHNGQIKPLSIIPSLNPAVLSFHPSNPKTLYILSEGIVSNGMISKIEYDFKSVPQLEIINHDSTHQQTNGKSLCYFKIDPISQQYGIAINYWDGSIDIYTMKNNKINKLYKHIDTMQLSISLQINNKRRQVQNRKDHWANRQVGPHAHSVHFYKNWVFVPDLGENAIFQYAWNPAQNVIMEYEAHIKLVSGNGPRHMVFHPTLAIAYVSNELSSSITVLMIDDTDINTKKCRLKIIQHIHTDKNMFIKQDIYKKNYVAEIGISFDGKFIYCSNRGYDTIAVFKVLMDGLLEVISYVNTFGKTPRHFAITPDNKYLVGANQDSNNLVVFERDLKSGALQLIKKYDNLICAPNYVLFSPFNVSKITVEKKISHEMMGNVKNNVYGVTLFLFMCLIVVFVGVFF